ncbi:heparin lyase I family protein [Ruficoccus sp. ZRK36]|uniref:heparin lyase I family protein n=1 Tax=Ruficoccus sp. ZRK36 TaxID=2866311 RepID=UPI001C7345FB|nr:heparin lyase I family protein [Ruficoccus sp. ZRK36]QYY34390.1 polysaccharide lyase [Ruficoccus sp. ZRK36]
MPRVKTPISCIALLACCCIPMSQVNAEILFEDGFESGDYTTKWNTSAEGPTSLIEVVSSPVRSGSYAVHMKTTGANGDRRAELVPITESFYWEQEYWLGFSFQVRQYVGECGIIVQHHSVPHDRDWSVGAGPNGFTLKAFSGGFLDLHVSTNDAIIHKTPDGTGADWGQIRVPLRFTKHVWYDVVCHFRYAADSTGFWEVWINDELVYRDAGPNIGVLDRSGTNRDPEEYLKIGLYPSRNGADGEVFFDEIRIGDANASYYDVRPAMID